MVGRSVGRSGKTKENEHLWGSGSREGRAAKVSKPGYKVKSTPKRGLFVRYS